MSLELSQHKLFIAVTLGCLLNSSCINSNDSATPINAIDPNDPSQTSKYSTGKKPLMDHFLTKGDAVLLDNLNRATDSYIKSYIEEAIYQEYLNSTIDIASETEVSASESSSDTGYSQTNLIEQGVDEADFVKQNANFIFLYSNKDDLKEIQIYSKSDFKPDTLSLNNSIISVNTLLKQQPAPIGTLPINPVVKVEGMYLTKDNLYVVNIKDNDSEQTDYHEYSMDHNQNFAEVTGYDMQDIPSSQANTSVMLSGSYQKSRKLKDDLYVVMTNIIRQNDEISCDGHLQYEDKIEKWQQAPEAAIKRCQQKYRLTQQELTERMPLDLNETRIKPDECYIRPFNEDLYASDLTFNELTLIHKIDLKGRNDKTTCVVNNGDGFYMSNEALYFANSEYYQDLNQPEPFIDDAERVMIDDMPPMQKTTIHKFTVNNTDSHSISYVGTGQVEGVINDEVPSFSMNEYKGVLRIATTGYDLDGIKNRLYTLKESKDSLQLITLATLPNKQHPKAIGKPDERIKGIRFMGDKGYIVTFRDSDPLYKIDLIDPVNPVITGELEMPGYSAYLHKINDDYLMGIGYTVNEYSQPNGIQTTIFDVTEVLEIVAQDTVHIQDGKPNPEFKLMVDTDSKALSSIFDKGVFKVTIPYIQYQQNSYQHSDEDAETQSYGRQTRALEYEIDTKTGKFINRYRRDGQFIKSDSYQPEKFRALIDGDQLYYITNDGILNKYLWGKP